MSTYQRQFKRSQDYRALFADFSRRLSRTEILANPIADSLSNRFHRTETDIFEIRDTSNNQLYPNYDALLGAQIPSEPDFDTLKCWIRFDEPYYPVNTSGIATTTSHLTDYSGFDHSCFVSTDVSTTNYDWVDSRNYKNGLALRLNPSGTSFVGSNPAGLEILSTSELLFSTTQTFSISMLINPISIAALASDRYIVGKSESPTLRWGIAMIVSGSNIDMNIFVTEGGTEYKVKWTDFWVPGDIGTWVRLTATVDPTTDTAKLYKNKTVSTTASSSTSTYNTSTNINMSLGQRLGTPTTTYFSGLMDEFQYYNRVLTQAEVDDLVDWGTTSSTVTVTTFIVGANLPLALPVAPPPAGGPSFTSGSFGGDSFTT